MEMVDLGRSTLSVRAEVACRQFMLDGYSYWYLSLFDAEIDERALALAERLQLRQVTHAQTAELGLCLEPVDALIRTGGEDVTVWKGGACAIPLYWRAEGDGLALSTRLPHPTQVRLSKSALMASFAIVGAVLQNDQNLVLRTPIAGWRRFRRGAATHWRNDGVSADMVETPIDFAHARLLPSLDDYHGILEGLRHQLDLFGRSQTGVGPTVLELSGGMDSTLAASAVSREGQRPCGISIDFPFYEFRFEDELQVAAASLLRADRILVDGRSIYAYTPHHPRLELDEPAILCLVAQRENTFAKIASDRGARHLLVGEGGDQLFSEHLFEPMEIGGRIDPSALTKEGYALFTSAREAMEASPAVYLQRSTMNFSYDARLAPAIKGRWGVIARTPFTDLGMVECGVAYARWCAKRGFNPGKKVFVDAFADVLPQAIRERRGKVTWEGVYARTYMANASNLTEEFESCRGALEVIGFDVGWMLKRIDALGRLALTAYARDDREILSAYALAYWLNEKGVRHASDCAWAD